MKRSFSIITIVFIIITFLILNMYTESNEDSVGIGNFFIKEKLDANLIENYLSSQGEARKQIEESIKQMVIKDMELDRWLEYLEYIEIIIYPVDIIGDSNKELVIGLNLSKNLGAIGIYKLDGDDYVLTNKIDNLTTIEKISVERNSSSDKRFLVVEEFLDERVGAYFTDRFVRIFTEIDNKFEEVFRQSIEYEAYYYEKWLDPNKENPKWFRLNENSIVDYDSKIDKNINLTVSKNIKKSEGKGGSTDSIPTEFKEVEQKNFEIKYFWNEEYKRFITGKGEVISTGEEVAILEDTSKTVDYLLNSGDKYYKVINKNMKIKYIKSDDLKINDL